MLLACVCHGSFGRYPLYHRRDMQPMRLEGRLVMMAGEVIALQELVVGLQASSKDFDNAFSTAEGETNDVFEHSLDTRLLKVIDGLKGTETSLRDSVLQQIDTVKLCRPSHEERDFFEQSAGLADAERNELFVLLSRWTADPACTCGWCQSPLGEFLNLADAAAMIGECSIAATSLKLATMAVFVTRAPCVSFASPGCAIRKGEPQQF
eukprot:TRINITY_DN50329_c0_g1_i1.p1 TRINITY_DN50329_c0_g1~~TRINITY_DN50329_c0_g1_i1.p1  ORF type:complete len:208 (-),score=29.53 TRINITY_DN50329_c0_g1_i1:124-747(-)